MKLFSFIVLVLTVQCSFAASYYFSATSGDDNRPVQQAQNPATPWRTLSKLNSFFNNLNAGDVVYLKRGDVFYGSIRPTKSGTSGQPITISAYGAGARPIVSGLSTLTNWVSVGNGIWESYNGSLGNSVSTVLLNNANQPMGRYPNSDAPNKGYLTYEAFSNTSITDYDLSSSINWTGAEVVIRKLFWIMDRNVITSHSGGTLNYISGSGYSPWQNKSGYFIQNDIRTLDQFGEWYYNPSTRKMYVYFGGNSPSNYAVQASSIDNLVTNAYSIGSITFDNITFKGSNSNAFQLAYGDHISINNCDIMFSGGDGVKSIKTENFSLQNSYVGNSNNNAISLEYSNNNAIVRNNKIENTHLIPGMGRSGDGHGFGLQVVGNNNLVEYNEVLNTGYSAIFFSGNGAVVKNNFLNNYCLTKDDGAGIYTNTEPNEVSYTGRKIVGNIILNGKGTPEGLADGVAHAHGIYLDGLTTGLEVTGNTVANNSSYGIFSPNPSNVNVNNNVVYNNSVQFVMNHSIKNYSVYNNNITNNIFFSRLPSQMVTSLTTLRDDIISFGSFNNNYYARPFEDKMTLHNQYVNATGTVSEVYDLETWRAKYNRDGSSNRSPVQYPGFIVNNALGSNTVINGSFNSNVNGVGGWTALNNMVISHANGVLDGGSLQISFNAVPGIPGSSLITMNVGGLNAGKKYILKFSLKGSNDNLSLGAFLRKNGGTYSPITAPQYAKISSGRTENELLFTVPESEGDAAVVFTVDNQNIKFWMDNIQFYEADVTLTNPDDYLRFEYNSSNSNKTVSLDKTYVDVKNTTYTGSVTLKPYSSIVLMKSNTQIAAQVDNTPPTIIPRNITITANGTGSASIQTYDVIQSITDNSGVDHSSVAISQSQFNCGTGSSSNSQRYQAFSSTTDKGNQSFSGELGLQFKVNDPRGIVINQLGAFDHDGNGILGSENGGVRVAIFNKATKSIVPGLDVNISGFADGYARNHRLKNVAPVTLLPGDYVVVAKGYNDAELNGNTGGGTAYADADGAGGAITLIGGGLYGESTGSFNYPTQKDEGPGYRYFAGTFIYSSASATATHQAYIATTTRGNQSFGGELGKEFKVNSPAGITINQLGAFDHDGNGITGTQDGGIRVAIFNKWTRTIVPGLDAVIAGNADAYTGNHRMKNIAPVTLMPGDYVLVSKGYNQNELNGNAEGGSPFPAGDLGNGAISYASTCLYGSEGIGFNFPTTPDGGPGNRYLAGTFSFSTGNSGAANNSHVVTISARDIHGNLAQTTATVTVVCDQNFQQAQQVADIQAALAAPDLLALNRQAFKVFPNPTTGKFSVQLPPVTTQQVSIQILTESGKLVTQRTTKVNGTTAGFRQEFNITGQAPGVYVVKIISTEGVQLNKVVLVR